MCNNTRGDFGAGGVQVSAVASNRDSRGGQRGPQIISFLRRFRVTAYWLSLEVELGREGEESESWIRHRCNPIFNDFLV